MKDKPFIYQDNRALHERRMKERTRTAISKRNIEFILAHQSDSLKELAQYLRECKEKLGHVPAQSEVLGGDLLELRFGSWKMALIFCGFENFKGVALSDLSLERTALFRAEYDRQSELHVQAKKDRKRQAKLDRREQKSAKKREKKAAVTGGSK